MSKPLKWLIDWQNLTAKEKFLMGTPFIGPDAKAYKDIKLQLQKRSEADLKGWSSYPKDVSETALEIINLYKHKKVWPNPIFLPNDPADIAICLRFDLTDKWDLLPESVWIIEKDIGVKMSAEFWENLHELTFYQAIEEIIRVKKTK